MPFCLSRCITLACLWLALATVLAHAVIPIGSPIARQSGSAFSISTSDVALTPKRNSVPGKSRRLLQPGKSDGTFASAEARAHLATWSAPAEIPRFAGSSGLRRAPAVASAHERRAGAIFQARAPPVG
ncbi:hypothetical protein [Sphingosinicella sp. CPCC 101087]|uniref:hypothetical protein n=1 Tax=Sphingosinicella sp. CPCC 101087 TaxID=2497754 RepID=UPI00101CA820|nr:hypothetical protein [Sphingosinicella sp. CPCC 101087]